LTADIDVPAPITFVVRVLADEGGGVRAVVELVRTGEKHRVDALEAVSSVIAAMTRRVRESDRSSTHP
jgi:hypothetical protein